MSMTIPGFNFIYFLLIIVLINSDAIGGISPGDRVKIEVDTTIHKKYLLFIPYSETEKRVIIGRVVSITKDSISIIDDTWTAEVRHLLTSGVKCLYVSEGIKRNTVRGILNGAYFGGCLFGILLIIVGCLSVSFYFFFVTNKIISFFIKLMEGDEQLSSLFVAWGIMLYIIGNLLQLLAT